jgi:hypothetical protein
MRYKVFLIDPAYACEIPMVVSQGNPMSVERRWYEEAGHVEAESPMQAWRMLHSFESSEVGGGSPVCSALGAGVRDVQFGDALEDEDGHLIVFSLQLGGFSPGEWRGPW